MENNYINEQKYLRAKKRVKEIKGFYAHLTSYVLVNIFISGVIIFGLTRDGSSTISAFTNFGVYATWIFWGIGLFFHWLGVIGSKKIGFGKGWEERKIKEYMDKEETDERTLTRF